ncbi:transcriptional regulator FtsR [Actinomadura violacea]|uniref:MerR family transcriptional regulator n=1 Tax=Actinomadura violacea TaxID=2819934 RepID=A0ABS3RVP4_9ACTN|nr:MerR family transcriptional regulator [Actinomadura violacea]MBO2460820.1 MerR family transcriptional regulator [Actinomadura violacea]
MNAQPARSPMTIGDVLGLLRTEFPDITISKIRFLETEGLVEPERTPAGYRKFGQADVERLRFVLTAQRDHYMPLRVIRQHLEARDRGEAVPPLGARPDGPPRRPRTLVAAGADAPDPAVRLTRRQLLDGAGIGEDLLGDLEEYGLVRRNGGHYDGEALTVARAAAALGEHGFEVRHLRAAKAAADRQAGLIEQMVAPQLRRRSPGAHEQAAETARDIAALSVRLHAALLSAGLRESLDP